MTTAIGPSTRAQMSLTMPSQAGMPDQRGPTFNDLLAMGTQAGRDGQPQSFASTGMLGRGMKPVEEAVQVSASGASAPTQTSPAVSEDGIGAAIPTAAQTSAIEPLHHSPLLTRQPVRQSAGAPAHLSGPAGGAVIADRSSLLARSSTVADPADRTPTSSAKLHRDLQGGSESAVRFAAHLSEAGVRVFARLSPLEDTERQKLRSAISNLLNQYGAVTDGITLSEVALPIDRNNGSGNNGG